MPPRPGYRRKDYNREPSKNAKGPKAVEPFSPWQLLVEKTREKKLLTIRALAEKSKIADGTMFNWVRAKTGCPPYTTYKKPVNANMAAALDLEPEILWKAYQESLDMAIGSAPLHEPNSPKILPPENSVRSEHATTYRATPANGSLSQLLNMLRASGRQSFTIQQIEIMISLIISPEE